MSNPVFRTPARHDYTEALGRGVRMTQTFPDF
jgi:hypothetical protein